MFPKNGRALLKNIVHPKRFRTAGLNALMLFGLLLQSPASGSPPVSPTLVRDGDNLQKAIDAARGGDILLLEAGATFAGPFWLPTHAGDAYVTIRTSTSDDQLPGTASRVQPADAPRLARLTTADGGPVMRTRPGAHHWRLTLLEFQGNPEGRSDILRLGEPSDAQRQGHDVPHHLVVDRCYIHGDPRAGQKNGIALHSGATEIRNSHISGINSRGQESHAIVGWNGPGPYVIVNNLLEASGINVMFGGANPAIEGLVPADIRIERNHIRKDPDWLGKTSQPRVDAASGRSSPQGPQPGTSRRFFVKNLLELKSARRVVIDRNLLEYNWFGHSDQTGYAVLFRSENPGRAPWSVVEEVAFTNNIVRHSAGGISIVGIDSGRPAERARDIRVVNNLWLDIDPAKWSAGNKRSNARFASISGADRVTFDRNTVVNAGTLLHAGGVASKQFVFTRNVAFLGKYGVKGDSQPAGRDTLAAYFPGAVFRGNVLAGGPARKYPSGNRFSPVDEHRRQFVSVDHGDYRLRPDSIPVAAAGDGDVPGVNIEMLCDDPCAAGRAAADRP